MTDQNNGDIRTNESRSLTTVLTGAGSIREAQVFLNGAAFGITTGLILACEQGLATLKEHLFDKDFETDKSVLALKAAIKGARELGHGAMLLTNRMLREKE